MMTGDVVVNGRTLDVAVDLAQLIDSLNWPDIVPAWMSHMEARRAPLSLFNDVGWAAVADGDGFTARHRDTWSQHRGYLQVGNRRSGRCLGSRLRSRYCLAADSDMRVK